MKRSFIFFIIVFFGFISGGEDDSSGGPGYLQGPCRMIRTEKNGKSRNNRVLVTIKGTRVSLYLPYISIVFTGDLKNNVLETSCDMDQGRNYLSCRFYDDNINGFYESWNVFSPERKQRYEFRIEKDLSPEAEKYWNHFLLAYQRKMTEYSFDPDRWWAAPERQKQRERIAAFRKELCIEFDISGIVVDPENKPVPGVVIGLACRIWGEARPEGLYIRNQFIATDNDGKFTAKGLFGESLSLFYNGEKYEKFREDFNGRVEILEKTRNPIVIHLSRPKTRQEEADFWNKLEKELKEK